MLTPYLATQFLDHLRPNGATWAKPSGLYLKLHTGWPGPSCQENASTVATRSSVTFGAVVVTSTVAIAVSNSPSWSITDTEILTHLSLWDAATGGNGLVIFEIGEPFPVYNGETYTLDPGSLLYVRADSVAS